MADLHLPNSPYSLIIILIGKLIWLIWALGSTFAILLLFEKTVPGKKFNSCFSSILPFGPWSEHPTPTQSPVLGMSSTFATTTSFLHAVQTLEPWCVLCLCYCCWTISKTPTSNPCPLPNVQPNSGQHNSHELYQLILFLVWIVKKYIKESLCQVSA